jgi:hypothetical protein
MTHQHKEAFCLMWYGCDCGHMERIWNSRDGVTPFSMTCPSCGKPDLHHVFFGSDLYSPNHKPEIGQRIWVSMTKPRTEYLAIRTVSARKAAGRRIEDEDSMLQSVADSYYEGGKAPDLQIFGYSRDKS